MTSNAGELDGLQERLGGLLAAIALREPPAPTGAEDDAAGLIAAFGQLLDVMQRLEADRSLGSATATSADATELGGYAFSLMERVRQRLMPATPAEAAEAAGATAAFTAWIVRHGGRVGALDAVVDSLALLANQSPDPGALADLAVLMLDTVAAAAPIHAQDLDSANPGRPWRLLHLNAAIAATRSRRPQLMERAFALLEAHLPQDAAQFFQQGMRQMGLADYPQSVRSVMQKYFEQWNTAPAIH